MSEFIEIAVGEPVEVPCGPLRFLLRRREVGEDGGLSLELHAPSADEDSELIRFDLFRLDPHFHVPAGSSKPTGHLDPASDTLGWALARIEHELPSLLRDAGSPEHADSVEALVMDPVIAQLREAAARAPEPAESRRIELTPEIRELVGL